MPEPKSALMTVVGRDAPPTLSEAAAQIGVKEADLNADFGVVPVDADRHLYAVEVQADRLPHREPQEGEAYRGPFSNPPIAPFGPVEPDRRKK